MKKAAWISAANLPVSDRVVFNNMPYLLEGRPGIAQMTSLILTLAPEQPIRQAVDHNRFVFGSLFFMSLLLIIVIARNVANDILLPINSLIYAMQQVVREEYAYRIGSSRNDELGRLCQAFDSMIRGLEEKKLMGRMLSKSAQKSSLQEAEAKNRRAKFAFLYIGIPTFDAWTHGVTREVLFADLQKQVSLVASLIIENGGDIDKIIGEKILAVFHDDGNSNMVMARACNTARQILKAEAAGQLPFPAAMGINCGEVITGFLGVGEKRDFTVIGDAVNVTARIEGLAEKMRYYRCLVSQEATDAVEAEFDLREYGEVELKGKSGSVKVFQLSV